MRVSTSTLFDLGIQSISQQQSDLLRTQQQISSGRRVLTPSDDPVASSRALEVSQSLAVTQQYVKNADAAKSSLSIEDTVLGSVSSLIIQVKESAIQAGNGALSASDLSSLAADVRTKYTDLLALANQTDGNGRYLFSGYQGATAPFSQSSGPGVYAGDQGQRLIQISPSRQIAVSDAGSDIFKPGSPTMDIFKTIDDLANALQSGTVTPATVSNALNGLDASLTNVSKVRASVGARLKELDSVQTSGQDLALQYQQNISSLQDLDYAQAISNLNKQQISLQAAQQSYLKVTGLSLFNYL